MQISIPLGTKRHKEMHSRPTAPSMSQVLMSRTQRAYRIVRWHDLILGGITFSFVSHSLITSQCPTFPTVTYCYFPQGSIFRPLLTFLKLWLAPSNSLWSSRCLFVPGQWSSPLPPCLCYWHPIHKDAKSLDVPWTVFSWPPQSIELPCAVFSAS